MGYKIRLRVRLGVRLGVWNTPNLTQSPMCRAFEGCQGISIAFFQIHARGRLTWTASEGNSGIKKGSPHVSCDERASLLKKWRPPTLPHCIAVPSAQAGLTSLFGMGRGGTPPQ